MNEQFSRQYGAESDGSRVLSLFSGRKPSPGEWVPTGNWRDDRIMLERGVRWGETHVRVIPLDRYRFLFICAGSELDSPRKAVHRIQRGRAFMAALLRSADYALFLVDSDGVVLEYNPAARALVDEGIPQLTGIELNRILHLRQGERPLMPFSLVRKAMDRGEDSLFSADISLEQPRELFPSVEVEVFPLRECCCGSPAGEGGEEGGEEGEEDSFRSCALITIRNVEERRRIHSDLRYVQHAENVIRAVSGTVHEIINSCTALFAQIDLVHGAEEQDRSTLTAAVRRMQRLGYRLAGFTGGIGAAAEFAGNRDSVTVEETVINAVDLALSGTSVRATFGLAAAPGIPGIAPERLAQVVFNLVTNAVEAMAEGGIVHIESSTVLAERMLKITVRDEGHGMDPRMLEEAVKPYFTTREGGIGMGLTVSASILEECGGRMEISTDPGFGTTVDLFIPMDQADADVRERKSGGPVDYQAVPDITGLPVLLVEDDTLVRRSMERSLRVLGCDVTTVENGDRALPLLQSRLGGASPFRLLITDLTMPGRLDGVGLLRRVRELDPDIPAILSTGTLHYHRGRPQREAGFQAILRKPFGLDQLRDSIRTAFRAAG